MIKNICGIVFSIGVIGFAIYYINNNYIKEGFGIDNNEYQDKDTSKIFLIKNKVDGTYNVNTKIDKIIDDKIDDEIVGLLNAEKTAIDGNNISFPKPAVAILKKDRFDEINKTDASFVPSPKLYLGNAISNDKIEVLSGANRSNEEKTEFMYYLYLFPFQIDDDNEKIIKRIDNIKDHTHILFFQVTYQ